MKLFSENEYKALKKLVKENKEGLDRASLFKQSKAIENAYHFINEVAYLKIDSTKSPTGRTARSLIQLHAAICHYHAATQIDDVPTEGSQVLRDPTQATLKTALFTALMNQVIDKSSVLLVSTTDKHGAHKEEILALAHCLFNPYRTPAVRTPEQHPQHQAKQRALLDFLSQACSWDSKTFSAELEKLLQSSYAVLHPAKKASPLPTSTHWHDRVMSHGANLGIPDFIAPPPAYAPTAPYTHTFLHPASIPTAPYTPAAWYPASAPSALDPNFLHSEKQVPFESAQQQPYHPPASLESAPQNTKRDDLSRSLLFHAGQQKASMLSAGVAMQKKKVLSFNINQVWRKALDALAAEFSVGQLNSDSFKQNSGGMRVRTLTPECATKLLNGQPLQQPYMPGGQEQFERGTSPILIQNVSVDETKWAQLMSCPVKGLTIKGVPSSALEATLDEWITAIPDRYGIALENPSRICKTLQKHCSQAVLLLSPVDAETKEKKATITCEAAQAGTQPDDLYFHLILEQQTNPDSDEPPFYKQIDYDGMPANSSECLALSTSCLTVRPIPNSQLDLLVRNLENKNEAIATAAQKATRHLSSEHLLIVTVKIRKIIEAQHPVVRATSLYQTDNQDKKPKLIARGYDQTDGGPDTDNDDELPQISDMSLSSSRTAPLPMSSKNVQGNYTLLSANMIMLKCEALPTEDTLKQLCEHRPDADLIPVDAYLQDRIKTYLTNSLDRLSAATGLSGPLLHDQGTSFSALLLKVGITRENEKKQAVDNPGPESRSVFSPYCKS